MGCRSSAPLDVVDEIARERDFRDDGTPAAIELLSLADLAAFDDRRRFANRRRGHRNHDDRMADIAALQHSLSMMEHFFETLIGQSSGFYMEAFDPNNNAQGPPPASDAAIASLLNSPLTEKELVMLHNKMCSVCCESLKVKEVVSRLPCGHVYHPKCVEPWLARHCTCPACRYELPTDDDDFEEGRLERMNARKLPDCCCQDDASSHSSEEDRPDITWDETSTTFCDEEGVHLMDGFQHWYEDFREQEENEFGDERSWMIRLIDEDLEDRPTSTLPAAMERVNSGEVREEGMGEEQRTAVEEEPTPRASNATQSKTHFDGHGDAKHGLIEAEEEGECAKVMNEIETFAPVQEVNVE